MSTSADSPHHDPSTEMDSDCFLAILPDIYWNDEEGGFAVPYGRGECVEEFWEQLQQRAAASFTSHVAHPSQSFPVLGESLYWRLLDATRRHSSLFSGIVSVKWAGPLWALPVCVTPALREVNIEITEYTPEIHLCAAADAILKIPSALATIKFKALDTDTFRGDIICPVVVCIIDKASQLKHLELSHNVLTGEVMEAIAGNRMIQYVDTTSPGLMDIQSVRTEFYRLRVPCLFEKLVSLSVLKSLQAMRRFLYEMPIQNLRTLFIQSDCMEGSMSFSELVREVERIRTLESVGIVQKHARDIPLPGPTYHFRFKYADMVPLFNLPFLTHLEVQGHYPPVFEGDELRDLAKRSSSLRHLNLFSNPTTSSNVRPMVEIDDIRHFAEFCLLLKTLGLHFMIMAPKRASQGEVRYDYRGCKLSLKNLIVGRSSLAGMRESHATETIGKYVQRGVKIEAYVTHREWKSVQTDLKTAYD